MIFNHKIKSSFLSILSNSFLIVFKLIIGICSGSTSVISDAIHSLVDLISSVGTTISLVLSNKPPDKQHNYGHQKIESIGSLAQFLLICGSGLLIIIFAISKIINPTSIVYITIAFTTMFLSAIINLSVALYLEDMAKQYSSVALNAESLHRFTDVWSSLAIGAGLVFVYLTHLIILDSIISIIVGLYICYESIGLLKKSLNDLLDHSLPDSELDVITDILNKYKDSYNNYYDLKTRKNGNKRYIEMKLNVDGSFTMSKVSKLCHSIEKDINDILKDTDVLIQVESNQNKQVSYSNKKNKLKMKIIYKNY